ncbi:CgeB family protein [Fulvivirga lutea]|uniref:Uncharacterized protein n=1 Tax=Fulvivirga lutea TaxID=2810512 RepID=A0A974WEF4_9BACT|nr:hypothetical protein [Fulvivirga lutea]QSE96808.1 hypothetical protein JR347_14575 [Fulvivirga lutea]
MICIVPHILSKSIINIVSDASNIRLITFNYLIWAYYISKISKWQWPVNYSLQIGFNHAIDKAIKDKKVTEGGVLLVIAGMKLSKKNEMLLKATNTLKILWYTDSVSRAMGIQHQEAVFEEVWYHDGGDFENSNHSGKKWVPYGFDSTIYFQNQSVNKDIDILFTGYLKQPQYKTRLEYLELLMNSDLVKNNNVVAAVTTQDLNLREKIKNSGIKYTGRLPENEYAAYIKRAKIVINILQNDGIMPINPLFFAIPNAGSIQIIDKRPYLNLWLVSKKHFLETTPANFIELIQMILEDKIVLDIESARGEAKKHSFQSLLSPYLN